MCGIVGYIGERNVTEVLLDGLRRLEYRGYDSSGLAVRTEQGVEIVKEVGKVADLARLAEEKEIRGRQGIGHTRWATHGGVTLANAHPHCDDCGRIVLVHNGIVENYLDLREELERGGAVFATETDTEVVAQLLSRLHRGDMVRTLVELQSRLVGSYALAILDVEDRDRIYCVRKGSPLILGLGEGETFCASDVPAVLPYTRRVVYLDDGDMAVLTRSGAEVYDSLGHLQDKPVARVDWDVSMSEKEGYPHYMLKEIHEQGAVLRATLKGRLSGNGVDLSEELGWTSQQVRGFRRIHLVACGTSYYAALCAERVFERWTDLEIRTDIASEYRYRRIAADPETLAIFVSQSGETADTLAAQRKVRAQGAHCLAVTNVRGSTLAREVHSVLLLKAGLEVGVAATKTFMGQLAALYLLALTLGKERGCLTEAETARLADEMIHLPYKLERTLERVEPIRAAAERYGDCGDFLFIGRGFSYPVALEGALKLKEISYIHAEAYAAGEMKHGPIALLDPQVPVLAITPRDSLYEKTLSNIQEARARRSPILAVGTDGDELVGNHSETVFRIPWTDEEFTPFLSVVPLQLFAYTVAALKGREIDQPRNLAKSVTVE
jgi:glucosamine--fructose-6-phosphate aminotransferase (isomerizing)